MHKRSDTVSGQLIIFLLAFITLSCSGPGEPIYTNETIRVHYPEVAEAVTNRNLEELLNYTVHESSSVREYAWKAVAMSDAEQPEQLIRAVIESNEPAAWFALSFHTLNSEQITSIKSILTEDPDLYGKACEIFKRQGMAQDVPELLALAGHPGYSQECALAAGTILSREEVGAADRLAVAEAAFETDDPLMRRNLLYGFYRSPLNRPEPDTDLYEYLMNSWTDGGSEKGRSADLFMVRILGEQAAGRVLREIGEIREIGDIQLAIELARNLPVSESDRDRSITLVKEFLMHDNPHVSVQTLETLKEHDFSDESLNSFIYREISSPTRNHELFITSLEYLILQQADLSGLKKKIVYAEESSPYLTNRFLELFRAMEPAEDYLAKIDRYMDQGGVRGMHAVQSLARFWTEAEGIEHRSVIHRLVREGVQNGDRSVISGLQTLLTDEELISEEDFEWIEEAYVRITESGNSENSQQLANSFESRFPERFVERHSEPAVNFREPDWEELYRLGTRPHWRLETSKGVIDIRLNPLSAPFTVSSIDSLTRGGYYDGVPFHRVVRNFVIQGGDFERKDGLGRPGYTLPTEPSLESYERGSAGIASSGPDTEGSQYFFMHIWAPHLDGGYTMFGEVVRGMEVIDRLQIGDRVERASVSIR